MHCRLWASFSCFLLVTALSRRHLALAALPPPVVRSSSSSSSEEPSAADYSVAWSSPASGDRFGPGDTVVGEWQVPPSGQKVVSPSFRLCVGGDGGCGATVWPEVVEESEGSYYVSLTAPSVATESGYYLQMKDDFGHAYSSPIFNITPTPQKKNKPAAHPPDVAQPRPNQAPMSSPSSSTGTKSKGATDSDPAPVPAPANPNGILSPPSAASSISLSSAASAPTPTSSSSNSSGNGGPQVAAAHNAPPTAALAVPLSLAGAIILLAGGLALHHRRRLAAEREHSWSLSRGNHHHHHDDDDVEKVLFARALFRGAAAAALPSRHAHDAYYDDRLREKADHLYSSSYAPSYAYRAPEPRQRTRELDLFPRREFTTSARPRAHHRSPSSSSSPSYRGLWARRYSVLRRGTSTSNGGGSLLRSLSFATAAAAARHKKVVPVAPVAPPSALNSPAMTAVTSVTSEVLPSYLPSPNFVGAADDQARGGDFGFENIPLSPPLPSPLHTRGEAADPDDSRMRELRGVYEAVARALGNMHGV